LLERLDEDVPLLKALLQVYRWLCPKYALRLPAHLWRALGMTLPRLPSRRPRHNRIRLLDSRGWFAAEQPAARKLEI